MEHGEIITLRKEEFKFLPGTLDSLEYLGIEDSFILFNFDKPRSSCKVLIPLERIDDRKNPITIIKYQFLVPRLTEEKITLKYLCLVSKMFKR